MKTGQGYGGVPLIPLLLAACRGELHCPMDVKVKHVEESCDRSHISAD